MCEHTDGLYISSTDTDILVVYKEVSVKSLGGDTEYPLAGLPIEQVLGVTFAKLSTHKMKQLLLIPQSCWHLKGMALALPIS